MHNGGARTRDGEVYPRFNWGRLSDTFSNGLFPPLHLARLKCKRF